MDKKTLALSSRTAQGRKIVADGKLAGDIAHLEARLRDRLVKGDPAGHDAVGLLDKALKRLHEDVKRYPLVA